MNIRDLLALPSARSLPRNEVRLFVAHVLQCTPVWLIAHDDEPISDASATQIQSLIARRIKGEPVAYLLGEREFYGRSFLCSPAALIPRPETELLVERALAAMSSRSGRELSILDVGTGTGCIAITLALEFAAAKQPAQTTAIDVSEEAIALARSNAQRLSASVKFIQSNWFAALPTDARFDLIVSNPPYIVPGDAHLTQGDLRFEPSIALADAIDGLQSYRELLAGAKEHLYPGGWLVVEHGYDQGESVPALFRAAGLEDSEMARDLATLPRITLARKPQ